MIAPRTRAQAIPGRELVTLFAYLQTGSHRRGAHRLGISESTSRQRISQLMKRLGVDSVGQAIWALREELDAEVAADGRRRRVPEVLIDEDGSDESARWDADS